MKKLILFALAIAGQIMAYSQTVETVLTNPFIADGLYVDELGNIYTTPGGLVGGKEIGKVTPDGQYTTFAKEQAGPIDIDRSKDGIFYITNYDDNTLKAFDPSTNTVSNVATDLDGPAGIVIDDDNTIYVSCFGAPPTYSGNKVVKILPNGEVTTFIESSDIFRPQGMDFDEEGNLYLADSNGKIFKINPATGEFELLTQLNGNLVNMEYGRGKLYVCAGIQNRIYEVDLEGNSKVFAGSSTPGGQDGYIDQATFNRPLGIAFTSSQDTMYIAESGTRRLRRILFDTPVRIRVISSPYDDFDFTIAPNPSKGKFTVDFGQKFDSLICISITDEQSREIYKTKVMTPKVEIELRNKEAGAYFVNATLGKKTITKKFLLN